MPRRINGMLVIGTVLVVVIMGLGLFWFGQVNSWQLVKSNTTQNTTNVSVKNFQANQGNTQSLHLEIETRGGLCPEGLCRSKVTIARNGSWITSNDAAGTISAGDIDNLNTLIQNTNLEAIKATPFTGLCPTAYDGKEIIYTFYTTEGQTVISTCQSQIDSNAPLFREIDRILSVIRSST